MLEIVSLVSSLKRLLSLALDLVNDVTVYSFSFHAHQNRIIIETVIISINDLKGYVNN